MKRRNFGILIAVCSFIAIFAVAIALNIKHDSSDTSRVASNVEIDNGDTKINWNLYQTYDVALVGAYDITRSGTYHFTGTLTDGSININPGPEGVVKIILDNVSIQSSDGPAINCLSGDDLVIELIGENYLSDSTAYSSSYDADVTGAIYSKADLTFYGDGSLDLTANYQDGIISKDDLKFAGGTYVISAVDDVIRGKDSVYITAGNFTLNAGADTIKATNETTEGKGFVMIENGNFNLISGAKGIKATKTILFYGGDYVINSVDDAIHSDNYIGFSAGNFSIVSDDDGVHANRALVVDGGTITVAKAYEGLEAQVVTINGGNIELTTTDDGINAGGGTDASTTNQTRADFFKTDENCILTINGGNVSVNASGDGIDSNGWLYFNGGKVTVDGPTNNGNGALDSGMGIVMNGGEVLAIGASGMAEALGNTSSVNNVSIYLTATRQPGTTIEIKDSADNIVLSHTSAKSFSHISAGTTAFKSGETYSLYLDGEKYQDFTISGITTTVGNGASNQQMAPSNNTNTRRQR